MRKSTLMVTLFTVVTAVTLQAQVVQRIFIKENTSPCTGVAPMNCLNVRFDNATNWELFYSSIEGFEYKPGFQYELLVEETALPKDQVPADASSIRYKLKKVVSKTAASKAIWNTNWTLVELNGKAIHTDAVKVEFNAGANSVYGKSGCNNFNMPLSANKKGTKIVTKHGAGTLMACQPDLMKLEDDFLKTLAAKKIDLKIVDGQLQLIHKKTVLMKFVKTVEKDHSALKFISNKKWKLIQMNGKMIEKSNPEITFDVENKKVNGRTGCNNFFGALDITDTKVHFGAVGMTRMACMDQVVAKQENEFVGLLNESDLTYDVADQTFNIYKNNQLVLMFGLTDN
ncbi:META domain-containing protein [Flavobacterium sp. NKUCC04_CG]|uniref:META domain-containing protein n=1 Tax=Flavobacterium sp. NKUCC04_CG TaxID=2842121 RepID=UPI001C5B16FA|nr:META domain-containing protein [Flavobacterium sp. NKUCC04_CG]MBW3519709.1 META domain-containing protein [Flavobacterium sp. NKUCC04_CG]